MKITVSAPGKIHLMGEHAVVHGKPALLAAANLRTYVTVENGIENGELRIEITTYEQDMYVRHIVEVVKNELRIDILPAIRIIITSEIPVGYHLGSSASVAVATIGALMYFLTKQWNLDQINALAYEAEKKMHGNPSGGDNTSATYGGFLWFRKELEWLKLKTQVPIALSQKLNHFFLIDTGRPKESTGEMVTFVNTQYTIHNTQYKEIFDQNEQETKRLAAAIMEEDEDELMSAIRRGEKTLEEMGVVSKKAISMIREVEKSGGAAKILGGGGRVDGVGFLLGYHPGHTMNTITLGTEGVRLETS